MIVNVAVTVVSLTTTILLTVTPTVPPPGRVTFTALVPVRFVPVSVTVKLDPRVWTCRADRSQRRYSTHRGTGEFDCTDINSVVGLPRIAEEVRCRRRRHRSSTELAGVM